MIKSMRLKVTAAAMASLIIACICFAQGSSAPAWTLKNPSPDAKYTYFVGWASNKDGDIPTCTDTASSNLVQKILSDIGVTITTETTAKATASLNSYQADLTQTVKTSSENRLSGFTVADKYIYQDPASKMVYVYILGRYVTTDLETERERIKAIFKEIDDATAVPEAAGLEMMANGRQFEAVQQFLNAALQSSNPKITNKEIKFTRNMNSARTIVSKLQLVQIMPDSIDAKVGSPYPSEFKVKLVYGDAKTGTPVPNANVLLTYPGKQGQKIVNSFKKNLVTGPDGIASIALPTPDFTGSGEAAFRLDFSATFTAFGSASTEITSQIEAMQREINNKIVRVKVNVGAAAVSASIGVMIIELDANGTLTSSSSTTTAAVTELGKKGFNAKAASIDKSILESGDDEAIAKAAKALSSKYKRFLYGTARVDAVRKDGTSYVVTVSGSFKIIDTATGDLLYSGEFSKTVPSRSSEKTAISEAFASLGRDALAQDIAKNLK